MRSSCAPSTTASHKQTNDDSVSADSLSVTHFVFCRPHHHRHRTHFVGATYFEVRRLVSREIIAVGSRSLRCARDLSGVSAAEWVRQFGRWESWFCTHKPWICSRTDSRRLKPIDQLSCLFMYTNCIGSVCGYSVEWTSSPPILDKVALAVCVCVLQQLPPTIVVVAIWC